MLTHTRLLELVHYDPETGVFTRIAGANRYATRTRIGEPLGCLSDGYLQCRLLGRNYRLHRLAWFYMTGEWPCDIDHRNRIKTDNRWDNLRAATHGQNRLNTTVHHNKTGFKGVTKLPDRQDGIPRYIARIGINKYLGIFYSPEAAYSAYVKEAKKIYGEFSEHLIL